MANERRLMLQSKLEELLGSKNVYYQPPASKSMEYPAIRYSKSKIVTTFANNAVYSKRDRYEVIVIDRLPDNPVIDALLEMPYCVHDRHYVADNLNHDVLTLYY